MQHLYWRNTKESIKNEYELPPLIEDLVLLNFTPVEAFIYRDCRNNYDIGMSPPPFLLSPLSSRLVSSPLPPSLLLFSHTCRGTNSRVQQRSPHERSVLGALPERSLHSYSHSFYHQHYGARQAHRTCQGKERRGRGREERGERREEREGGEEESGEGRGAEEGCERSKN